MSLTLTDRRAPWVVFTCSGDPWLADATRSLVERGGRVFRLDAQEMRDQRALFAESQTVNTMALVTGMLEGSPSSTTTGSTSAAP
ncbi:hypothetical protein AB0I28_35535 [Phytomonospora sp. NPDC050363]|uniref:hypothetical protein n=1 Tax=Phytomonospora sp. NPDC050363 TaxID=3155642 RepID=UPI0033E26FC3